MEKYGLVGYPLGHSFSRNFFNEKFRREGTDAEYINFEIPSIDLLPGIIAARQELRGLNVTIPYKEQIIPYLDELSDEARAIGAVNVVRIMRRGDGVHLKGFNSDVIGFMRSIEPLLHPQRHRKALILGTGGASKAVLYGLRQLGLATMYVSRSARPGMLTYAQLTREMLEEYKVVVNCTPVGMYPHTEECPELPYELLTPEHLLYDLVYNPEETMFLRKGRERGAAVKNGLEMLHLQALAGWEFWHSKD